MKKIVPKQRLNVALLLLIPLLTWTAVAVVLLRDATLPSTAFGAALLSIAALLALAGLLWRTQGQANALARALARAQQRQRALQDDIDAVVWEADWPAMRFTYVSGHAACMTGYPAPAWLADPLFWQRHLRERDGAPVNRAALGSALRAARAVELEHRLTRPDGDVIWLRSSVRALDDGAPLLRLRGVTVDVSSDKQASARLHALAYVDGLTELPNRHSFTDRISAAIAVAEHDRTGLAVMFVDLDHFNRINDNLGHAVGDQVLKVVAQRIASCLRSGDTVARLGGDEFIVLMPHRDAHAAHYADLAASLGALADAPIAVGQHQLTVALSIGVSVFPQDGVDSTTLMRHADLAMYCAKAAGRNRWCLFEPAMAQEQARALPAAILRASSRGRCAPDADTRAA